MPKTQAGQESTPDTVNVEPLLPQVSDPGMMPTMAPQQTETREAGFRSASLLPTPEPLSEKDWFDQLIESGVSPLIAKAQTRHRRDLPELLQEHRGAWVAYKGDERLEIGATKTGLYRKYLDQRLGRDELLVLCVEPDLFDDELDFPLPT